MGQQPEEVSKTDNSLAQAKLKKEREKKRQDSIYSYFRENKKNIIEDMLLRINQIPPFFINRNLELTGYLEYVAKIEAKSRKTKVNLVYPNFISYPDVELDTNSFHYYLYILVAQELKDKKIHYSIDRVIKGYKELLEKNGIDGLPPGADKPLCSQGVSELLHRAGLNPNSSPCTAPLNSVCRIPGGVDRLRQWSVGVKTTYFSHIDSSAAIESRERYIDEMVQFVNSGYSLVYFGDTEIRDDLITNPCWHQYDLYNIPVFNSSYRAEKGRSRTCVVALMFDCADAEINSLMGVTVFDEILGSQDDAKDDLDKKKQRESEHSEGDDNDDDNEYSDDHGDEVKLFSSEEEDNLTEMKNLHNNNLQSNNLPEMKNLDNINHSYVDSSDDSSISVISPLGLSIDSHLHSPHDNSTNDTILTLALTSSATASESRSDINSNDNVYVSQDSKVETSVAMSGQSQRDRRVSSELVDQEEDNSSGVKKKPKRERECYTQRKQVAAVVVEDTYDEEVNSDIVDIEAEYTADQVPKSFDNRAVLWLLEFKIFPNLMTQSKKKHALIMDDTLVYKSICKYTVLPPLRRQNIELWLKYHGQDFAENTRISVLYSLCLEIIKQKHIVERFTVEVKIQQLIEKFNLPKDFLTIIWNLDSHPMLVPLELVWAECKRDIRANYEAIPDLNDLCETFVSGLQQFDNKTVGNLYAYCFHVLNQLIERDSKK